MSTVRTTKRWCDTHGVYYIRHRPEIVQHLRRSGRTFTCEHASCDKPATVSVAMERAR